MQAPKKTVADREAIHSRAKLTVQPLAEPELDKAAIADGRKPVATRRTDTTALSKRAAELYGARSTGFAALTPIEKHFKFTPSEADADFHFLQAEILLNQACAQLESCLNLRSQHDILQREKWKLQLEVDALLRLTAVEDQEREVGVDTLPYERAALASAAEAGVAEYNRNAELQLKGLMEDLFASGFNKRMSARELAAWISAYPLKDNDLRSDDAYYTFDGTKRSKPDHLFEAARLEADEAAWEQIYTLMAQRFAAMSQAEAARLRKESLDLDARASLANIRWRGERAAIVRDAAWEQVYQAQSADSILNYQQQVESIRRRFALEFQDALACVAAARYGLKELHDYAVPFPEEGSVGYLDEVVTWTRLARNRVAQLSNLDQHYVLAVSLKALTESRWEAGLKSSAWTFDVAHELFPGQTHVRLRGLSMVVLVPESAESQEGAKRIFKKKQTGEPGGFWSARVSLPEKGMLPVAAGVTRELDQKSIPVCHLGRVTGRDTGQEPEVSGANVFYNACPVGEGWRVALSKASTDGTPTETLQDIQLYLHLAVRDARA